MFELFISVADKLLSHRSSFRKNQREQRDRMANYFDGISGCLAEIVLCVQEEEADKAMHPCYRLEEHSERFRSNLGSSIELNLLDALAQLLKEATASPMLAVSVFRLADESEKSEALHQLSRASAKFAVLADEIRVRSYRQQEQARRKWYTFWRKRGDGC